MSVRLGIIDDHPLVTGGLKAALGTIDGIDVVAHGGTMAEARELLCRDDLDVVLLDVRLNDEDGLALCRTVRAETAPPQVVLYTASVDEDLVVGAAAAGAHAVVEKGADIDELFDALRLAVRERRQAA
jgi:two-component system nitrate/nitrite response regulator NarL